jgi:hypothetical protein
VEKESQVKRVPVDYRYDAVNPEILKRLARIGAYAAEKYGSWEQYKDARLVGEKSPINHALEHIRQYVAGEPYDHFDGDLRWHLAAAAYNLSMEMYYHSRWGYLPHPLTLPAEIRREGSGPIGEPHEKLNAIRRLIDGATSRTTFALADDIKKVLDAPSNGEGLYERIRHAFVETSAPEPVVDSYEMRRCQAMTAEGKHCGHPAPFYQLMSDQTELPLCGDHAKEWLGAAIEVKARDEASAKILAQL